MASIAFAVPWKLRIHRHRPGWLFCVYLALAGAESLLIESIRVNTTYTLFGVDVTQAQLIAARSGINNLSPAADPSHSRRVCAQR